MLVAYRPSSTRPAVVPVRDVVGELAVVLLGVLLVRDQLVGERRGRGACSSRSSVRQPVHGGSLWRLSVAG